MDAGEAREHLEMVDRILSRADPGRAWRPFPRLLVVIGLAAAMLDCGAQLAQAGRGSALVIAGSVLMLGCWAYLIWAQVQIRRSANRISIAQARMGSAIRTVWLCVLVAAFAQPHIFAGWAAAAIWSLGGAIQMLIVGFAGDRRATVAGLVILASILAANYAPGIEGYVLASGFVLGYVIPGVLYMFDKDELADCG